MMKRITLALACLLVVAMPAAADISFVGSAVGSSSPNTGTSVTLPGSMAVNDLIIVAAAVGDTANNGMAAPTEGSYTRIGSATIYSNDVNDTNLDLYYKFHNGSDTTVSFAAVGGTNASNAAVVMVFRGVKLVADGGPFDTAVSTTSGINTSNADPPSHDWSGAAGVWTVIAASTGHTGGATASFTFPTGYTTDAAQRAHNDTIDVLAGMGYKSAPSDPEDPAAFTAANIGTAADNAWAGVTMSLSAAPPPPPCAQAIALLGVGCREEESYVAAVRVAGSVFRVAAGELRHAPGRDGDLCRGADAGTHPVSHGLRRDRWRHVLLRRVSAVRLA